MNYSAILGKSLKVRGDRLTVGKVLVLTNSSGGLYDFRNEFIEALLKDNQVFISVPDDVKTEELSKEGCQIIKTPINRRGVNPIEDLKLYRAYRSMMKELQPDLVVTYTIKPNIYGGLCAGMRHIPCIATVTGLGSAFNRKGPLRWVSIFLYKIGLHKDVCVFFQNAENRELFCKYGIRGRKDRLVTGSGVNLNHHKYKPYPKSGETRFLYIGRVMKEKGIEEYLEAADRLHSDTVFFDIMGYCDEDYQNTLDELEKRGVIRQLGFQKEVRPYLEAASAVVNPSYHEGMSNVLMEAAATGRPVIASNISGCQEIFEEGETGFGFAPRNAKALVLALGKFLKLTYEERARMGWEARTKMEREFDRTLVTEAYMDEVKKILG